MSIVLDGTDGITTPSVTYEGDATINGLTVGRGAGDVATNTAGGASALAANTTGAYNTAIGNVALTANTTGELSVAVGHAALTANTTGIRNSALGVGALASNTTGGFNTALGQSSLNQNTTASNNTAVGYQAGYSNTAGGQNTAIGWSALRTNITGEDNVAIGTGTLYNATGGQNTAVGRGAGSEITTGTKNSILGRYNGNQGGLDIRTSSNNIVLSDGDGNPRVVVTNTGLCGLSGPSAGNYYATHTSGNAANVYMSTSSNLYRSTSSRKYKKDIVDARFGLSDLLKLRSVNYKGMNPEEQDTLFAGLIAEEVHDAGLTEFVQYAADGTPDALAYGNMVSLCIKAIQELKSELDTVKAELATLKGN